MPMQMVFTTTSTQPRSTSQSITPSVMAMSSGVKVVNEFPAMMQFKALSSYNTVRSCGACGGR